MNLNQRYPRNLDEERRLGWLGWMLLSGLAATIIFSAGVMDKLADYVKFMSLF